MQVITVTVNVPEGDQCTDETPLSMKVCDFYRGRSCVLFNKVIIEQKKCSECEETSNQLRRQS